MTIFAWPVILLVLLLVGYGMAFLVYVILGTIYRFIKR